MGFSSLLGVTEHLNDSARNVFLFCRFRYVFSMEGALVSNTYIPTMEDYLRFVKLIKVLREGTLAERKAIHENADDVKFIANVVDWGVLDKWLRDL